MRGWIKMVFDLNDDKYTIDAEGLTEEEIQAKKRFDTTPETTEVILTPQCVDCIHNGGIYDCAVLGEKPEEYIMNQTACPKRE